MSLTPIHRSVSIEIRDLTSLLVRRHIVKAAISILFDEL